MLTLVDNGSGFPLLERTRRGIALKDEHGTLTFSGKAMEVDTDAIVHFGLGILWKGGIHRWPTVERQTTSVALGPFKETIRKYLFGTGGFPPDVYVLIGVCQDKGSRSTLFAPSLMNGSKNRTFSLLVRGIWFHIVTDKSASAGTKELCCAQSELKVLHMEDCKERFLHAGRHIHKTARVSPNVKREIRVGP